MPSMRLDVLSNNEFHTRQPHTVIGQKTGLESQFRIADISMILVFRTFLAVRSVVLISKLRMPS